MSVEIRQHRPGKDLKDFIRVAFDVYADDPAWVAARVRTLTVFRIELSRIGETWPDTFAAGEASDLLLLHEAPEIGHDLVAALGKEVKKGGPDLRTGHGFHCLKSRQ